MRYFVFSALLMVVVPELGSAQEVLQRTENVVLRPGIIIQPAQRVAYVMTPAGGTAAVDTRQGVVQRRFQDAAMPLIVLGDQLVGQAESDTVGNNLELVIVNTRDTTRAPGRRSVQLPAGVRVGIGETLQGTFLAKAQPLEGDVAVRWTFVGLPRQGMRPAGPVGTTISPLGERVPARPQSTRGAIRISLTDPTVRSVDTLAFQELPPPRWMLAGEEKLSALPSTQYRSADNRHILVSEKLGNDSEWNKYRWTVYESGSRRRIGEVRSHLSFTPFYVQDDVLIFETTPYRERTKAPEPAKLRAVSLQSGVEVWSVEVRELVRRLQFPP